MINDIITVFERKFNKFADTTEAFTARFIRDEDSAIGTLCFNRFNVEFEYCLECGASVEKSGLNIIVDFTKRSEFPIKCMMYDIIGLFDNDNFACWFYCFIENEQRMELCFDRLAKDFEEVYPKMKEFTSSDDNMGKIREVLRKNVLNTVGIDFETDINSELENGESINVDEVYEYLFSLYFGFEQTAFSSYEYSEFLAGNYKKVIRKYEKKKKRLAYEDRLLEYMKNCDNPEPILSKEYECLKDGLNEYQGTNGFVPFFASCGLLLIPFLAVCVVMYFAISGILYRSAIYASALEPYNACCCLLPALLCSLTAAYFMDGSVYCKFFKNNKKFQKKLDYDAIFNSEKSKKRMSVILYIFYLVALIFVFLSANTGIAVYESGVNVNTNYFDINGDFYGYNDIYCLDIEPDGIEKKYYLCIDGTDSVDISQYTDYDVIENKIIPILENRQVEIIRSTE